MRLPALLILSIVIILILAVGFNVLSLAPRPAPAPVVSAPRQAPTAAPPQAPTAEPPAQVPAQNQPAGDTSVRNFTAQYKGRTVEGGFDAGSQHVDYVYRLKRVEAENGRLKTTGDIEYTVAGTSDLVRNVTARLLTQGDRCEQLELDTDPFRIPNPPVDVPAQRTSVDTTAVPASDTQQMQMFCQLTQLVQNNPNNPLVGAMVDQINRGL